MGTMRTPGENDLQQQLADGCKNSIIRCSDYRHEQGGDHGFRPHIEGVLGQVPFDSIVIPGACYEIVHGSESIKEYLFDSLALLIGGHGIERVALVQHTSCARYAHMLGHLNFADECAMLRRDMNVCAGLIATRFPNVEIVQTLLYMDGHRVGHLERRQENGAFVRVHPHHQRLPRQHGADDDSAGE